MAITEASAASIAFSLFQIAVCMAYLVTLIVVSMKYNQQVRKCPTSSAMLGKKTIVAYDDECVSQIKDKFTAAWIAIGVLGALIVLTLVIACVAGDGWSCFIAFLWLIFRN